MSLPVGQALLATGCPVSTSSPASVELAGAELELVDSPRREYRLHDALAAMAAEP